MDFAQAALVAESTRTSDSTSHSNIIGLERIWFNRYFYVIESDMTDMLDSDGPAKEEVMGRGIRFTLGMDFIWIELYRINGPHEMRADRNFFEWATGLGFTIPLPFGVKLEVAAWWDEFVNKVDKLWTNYLFS